MIFPSSLFAWGPSYTSMTLSSSQRCSGWYVSSWWNWNWGEASWYAVMVKLRGSESWVPSLAYILTGISWLTTFPYRVVKSSGVNSSLAVNSKLWPFRVSLKRASAWSLVSLRGVSEVSVVSVGLSVETSGTVKTNSDVGSIRFSVGD